MSPPTDKFRNRLRKREKNTHNSAPNWMVTYGDMVTLLLTFFVMLLSFASLDSAKFEAVTDSLKGAFGVLERERTTMINHSTPRREYDLLRRSDIADRIGEIEQNIENLGMQDEILIRETDTGILIRMGDRVLFDFGKAEIRPEAEPVLTMVGNTLINSAKQIMVSGHTDNIPIHTKDFPTNWELSSKRAVNVVRYLVEDVGMDPSVLAAVGYGEYQPLIPNTSPENRRVNRRVEFEVTWK